MLAAFVMLHTVDGRDVAVNHDQIASVTHAKDGESNKLLTAGVQCVLNMTNGKFISVIERCDDVLRKLEGVPP